MSSDRREKTLSVFLSILMVGSVMAIGGAAFAGSAAAQEAPQPGSGEVVLLNETGDQVDTYDSGSPLQDAYDDASEDHTILVGSGTFSVPDPQIGGLTIDGAGMNETTLETNQMNPDATNLTLRDFTVDAGGNNIRVNPGAEANGLRIVNVKVEEGSIGLDITAKDGGPVADKADGLYVENFHVVNNTFKGIYLERASNATLKDIYVDGILDSGKNYANNGIDINLKYDDYENITIEDTVVKGVEEGVVGQANPIPTPAGNYSSIHSAIAVKARDDGSYSGTPATLDGVTIDNVTVADSVNGLRFGEPGVDYSESPSGPTDVTITDSTFQNNERYHIEDLSDSVDLTIVQSNNEFVGSTIESDVGIFAAIQPAVDAASGGDTVSISDGTYNESVDIGTENVTLVGPNAGTPGDASRSEEATITQGVEISADGVTVDGLEVTNDDVNGIVVTGAPSDVTVTNTVIRDIAGGTAGASKGVGNGINLQFNDAFEQTSTGIEITDNLITNVTTADASGGSPDADAIGVQLLPRGNDVENLRIVGNTIENIEPGAAPGGRSEARAVSIGTQFTNTSGGERGDLGQATNLTVTDNEVSNLTADFARAVALFEDSKGAASTPDNRVGPVNFTITGNNVSNVNSEADFFDLAIFIGKYGDFGNDHIVQDNDFTGAAVENFGDSDALNTDGNTFSGDPKFDVHYTAANADLNSIINSNTFDRRVTIRNASGDLTGDTIFAGIQSAVDSTSSGDTVSVSDGTYNESVTITTQNITLVGPNADTPGDASRGDEAIVEGQINVNAQNVTIDGLQVTPGVDTFNETPAAAIIVYEPNATIRNNKVADFTINVTDISANSVQGIQIFEAGTELTGIEITNNSVENITYAGSSQAPNGSWGTDYGNLYGIHVQGEIGNAEIAGNTLQNLSSDGYTLAMAVSGTDSDPDASPDDIVIGGNTFANLNAKGAPATAFTVSSDRVNASNVSVVENSFDAPVDIVNGASETLEAPLNYYGDGDTPTIEGSVIYDPLLTVPIEQANLENPQEVRSYGSYLELDTEGEPAVIGFPAPPAEPLGELIPNETLSVAGEGAQVFLYDSAEQSFEEVNGSFVPDAGDVIVITTGGDALSGEIIVPVDTTVAGNAATPDSGTVDINEGWNLVATGAADGLTSPTATSDIVDAGQFQIQPDQPGAPGVTVGAYEGTWLFAESSGELTTGYRGDQPPSGYIDRVLIPEDDNEVN